MASKVMSKMADRLGHLPPIRKPDASSDILDILQQVRDEAEGEKKSAILIAEGEKESAILRAEAKKESQSKSPKG